jgi:hypothetical protein
MAMLFDALSMGTMTNLSCSSARADLDLGYEEKV